MHRIQIIPMVMAGLLSIMFAIVALLHVPITKFPTEWEVEKVERLVSQGGPSRPTDIEALKRSLKWIRNNNNSQLASLASLRKLSALGFAAVALLCTLQVLLVWRLLRPDKKAVPAE